MGGRSWTAYGPTGACGSSCSRLPRCPCGSVSRSSTAHSGGSPMLSKTVPSLADAPTLLCTIRTATPANAIEAAHISKRYRRYQHRDMSLKGWILDWLRGRRDQYVEFQALNDVSFSVPHDQVVGIVGN